MGRAGQQRGQHRRENGVVGRLKADGRACAQPQTSSSASSTTASTHMLTTTTSNSSLITHHGCAKAVVDKGHTQQHAEHSTQGLNDPKGPQPAPHAIEAGSVVADDATACAGEDVHLLVGRGQDRGQARRADTHKSQHNRHQPPV